MNKKNGGGKTLIGESSWDLECFKLSCGGFDSYFIHNDFFKSSNKKNTKLFSRILALLASFYFSIKAALKGDEIYYSSLNAEVLVVSYFFSPYKKAFIFLPNVIGDPSGYGAVFNAVLRKYKKRIYVTDSVSKSSLDFFSPILTEKSFEFKLPEKKELVDFTYIICFPAALSHTRTANDSDRFYSYTLEIEKRLVQYGLKVYVLFHPRDREYVKDKFSDKEIIDAEKISILADKVCYISASSSLSLNHRYGGEYGCWVSINGENGLPNSLMGKEDLLVDILYFEN